MTPEQLTPLITGIWILTAAALTVAVLVGAGTLYVLWMLGRVARGEFEGPDV